MAGLDTQVFSVCLFFLFLKVYITQLIQESKRFPSGSRPPEDSETPFTAVTAHLEEENQPQQQEEGQQQEQQQEEQEGGSSSNPSDQVPHESNEQQSSTPPHSASSSPPPSPPSKQTPSNSTTTQRNSMDNHSTGDLHINLHTIRQSIQGFQVGSNPDSNENDRLDDLRWQRIVENDTQNIPLAMIIFLLACLQSGNGKASVGINTVFILIYFFSRIFHTFIFALGVGNRTGWTLGFPIRTFLWVIGIVCEIVVLINAMAGAFSP